MKVIIIDPGHGGNDPGAIGYLIENGIKKEYKEADFTFDISKRVWSKLTSKYSVFLTRKEKETKSLNDRCLMAKKLNADLFLSIHINSALTKEAKGYEAYCVRTPLDKYATYKPKAQKFRDLILQELSKDFPSWKNRGGKEANFQVIKFVPCVSVLVELGFISNEKDLKFLLKTETREKIATSLARAVDLYATTFLGGKTYG